MILQVLPHAGPIGLHLNPQLPQLRGGAYAGKQQEFGRVDRGGGNNHLAAGADH